MKNYKDNWLPHLKDAIPEMALGKELSMYALALEGWRRGLILNFRHVFNNKENKVRVVYTLTYRGRKTHEFNASRGDKVSSEAVRICMDKDLTRTYLSKAAVPVPIGKGFAKDIADDEIIQYATSIGYPLVLKPTDGFQGHGVIVNIENEHDFKESLNYVRYELGYKEIVVEDYVQGEDCRIYVIEDKVIGAVSRIPAHIIGDGEHTISQLIKLKNNDRNNNPNHYRRPIKIDFNLNQSLDSLGYTLKTIPKKAERVYLLKTSNISSGGEAVDVTDKITLKMRETAINAVKAIPGLNQCAVDMLINKENNTVAVIEVNSKPLIGLHLFPEEGEARDIPKAIIDYYFPETKSEFVNYDFFFDFKSFLKSLRDGVAKDITVKKVPQYIPTKKQFVISGKLQSVGYKNWIRMKARSLRLNGFVENTLKGNISIVVAGEKGNIDEFKKIINTENPDRAVITNIKEKEWMKPVNVGFYMSEVTKDQTIRKLRRQSEKLKVNNDVLKNKYKKIINSKFYKYSAPLRKLFR